MTPPDSGTERPRHLVLQCEDLNPHAQTFLRDRCELAVCRFDDPGFEVWLAKAEALVVRTYTRVDKALLAKAPNLRVVGRAGVGLDRIDVAACRAHGVQVVHTPDANTVAVAEYVFAMLHDVMRPRMFLETPMPTDKWNLLRRELEAPRQFSELTFGVLGMGRIGKRVARMARGYDMRVIYHDVAEIPPEDRADATPVPLDELLEKCDVLSIHIDTRPSNRRFVNAEILGRLKKTAIVVNTSRGFIVDEVALADWLRTNEQATALIDVHDPEPFDELYCLLGIKNAHLSPHIAASTVTAHENMGWVVRDVWRVLRGETPRYPAP